MFLELETGILRSKYMAGKSTVQSVCVFVMGLFLTKAKIPSINTRHQKWL